MSPCRSSVNWPATILQLLLLQYLSFSACRAVRNHTFPVVYIDLHRFKVPLDGFLIMGTSPPRRRFPLLFPFTYNVGNIRHKSSIIQCWWKQKTHQDGPVYHTKLETVCHLDLWGQQLDSVGIAMCSVARLDHFLPSKAITPLRCKELLVVEDFSEENHNKWTEFRNTEGTGVAFEYLKSVGDRYASNRKGVPKEKSARKLLQ